MSRLKKESEIRLYKESNHLSSDDERAIFEAIKVFEDAGHSGFSASCIPSMAKALLKTDNKELLLLGNDEYGNMIRKNVNEAYNTIKTFSNNEIDYNLEKNFDLAVKLFLHIPLTKLTFEEFEWNGNQNNRLSSVFRRDNGEIEYLRDVILEEECVDEHGEIKINTFTSNSKLFFTEDNKIFFLDLGKISLNIPKYLKQDSVVPESISVKGINYLNGFFVESFYIDKILKYYDGKKVLWFQ